jgi:hypothetical protein
MLLLLLLCAATTLPLLRLQALAGWLLLHSRVRRQCSEWLTQWLASSATVLWLQVLPPLSSGRP